MTKIFDFKINPLLGRYSFNDLADVFEQNFDMFRSVCDVDFTQLTETSERSRPYPKRLIKFSPSSEFGNSNHIALARGGVDYNIGLTKNFSLARIRRTGFHELGHNLGLDHEPDIIESIMSTHPKRHPRGKSLLWRKDLNDLHFLYPKASRQTAWISVDTDYTVMIPSIMIYGMEMSVVLTWHDAGKFWMASHNYVANDGIDMIEKAQIIADSVHGDVLILRDVSFLGYNIPLVRMGLSHEGNYWKFRLI